MEEIGILKNLFLLFASGCCANIDILSEQFIGCFYYDHAPKTLYHHPFDGVNTNIDDCILMCREKKYTFAALQFGIACFCGESDAIYTTYTYQCYNRYSTKCRLKPKTVCGGGNANSVYAVCQRGYYGNVCQNQCDHCGEYGCDMTGKCLSKCPPGKTGVNCSKECDEKTFGPNCEYNCPSFCSNIACDSKIGFCTEGCVGDTKGPFCTSTVPERNRLVKGPCKFCYHCKNSECVGSGDAALYECPVEWMGSYCKECDSGKWGKRCEYICHKNCDGSCNMLNGTCTQCLQGFYGEHCNQTCSELCKGQICNMRTGDCLECGCGDYGKFCNKTCPVHCKPNCCDQNTGSCTGCFHGYYGLHCNKKCGACLNQSCVMMTGECDGCNKGYYGSTCHFKCAANCKERTCDKKSGVCTEGCISRYYSPYCNNSCPTNCEACDYINGSCISVCKKGFYGEFCSKTCPSNCLSENCDKTNGLCTKGCNMGYIGNKCNEACKPGLHGYSCSQKCNCILNTTCDHVTGSCPFGCSEGFAGDTCSDKILISPNFNAWMVACIILLCGLFIAIVIIIVLCVQRNKNRKLNCNQKGQNDQYESVERDDIIVKDSKDNIYEKMQLFDLKNNRFCTRFNVEDVKSYLQNLCTDDLLEQFKKLPSSKLHPWTMAENPQLKNKNRFLGILAYDHSRVILGNKGQHSISSYINANYIHGFKKEKMYIASQGVTNDTIEDIWMMIWQENIRTIVLTTHLFERGKVKCIQYWPDDGVAKYGTISVTFKDEIKFQDYVKRELIVNKGRISRNITQFHYLSWPENGSPDDCASLNRFLFRVRSHQDESDVPVMVQCSSGVGSSGTYIALNNLLEQAKQENWVDIFACVEMLRQDRINMVHTLDQYKFLHQALYEALFIGDTTIRKQNGQVLVEHMQIPREFNVLQQLEQELSMSELPLSPENDFLSFMRDSTGKLMVSKLPKKSSLSLFWENVMDKDVHVLLYTENLLKKKYWLPTANGPINLNNGKELFHCNDSGTDKIYIKDEDLKTHVNPTLTDEEHVYIDLDTEGTPNQGAQILSLYSFDPHNESNIYSVWKKLQESSNVLILCKDGTSESGVMCASILVLDLLDKYNECDLFDVARKLRRVNHGFINNLKQYEMVYKVLLLHATATGI